MLSLYPELRCDERSVRFDHPEARSIFVDCRLPEPHHSVYLARVVASLVHEEQDFRGAYLWVTRWGVWDDRVEAVALKAMERFRQGYGENRPMTTAPGHIFRHDEFVESVSFLVHPMLDAWDAYFVPKWWYGGSEYFVFVSHDSYLSIETRTKKTHEEAVGVLKRFEWISLKNENAG